MWLKLYFEMLIKKKNFLGKSMKPEYKRNVQSFTLNGFP